MQQLQITHEIGPPIKQKALFAYKVSALRESLALSQP
jgi:hypothetical protein